MRALGLIGAGRWGKVYLKTVASLADRCRLSHLCTSDPRNAEGLASSVTVTPDWQSVVRSDCDGVIIATPPDTHAQMLEACLEAGKPCLVEKPLCLDLATAERLHQQVQASGVPVLVDHTQLFSPAYEALKAALAASGETVQMLVSEGVGFGPFRSHTTALWDWCPHDVSVVLDVIGASPRQVDALGAPGDAPEQLSLRLDFPGGASAWIHAGRLSPQRRRTLSVMTEQHLYALDEQAEERVAVTPFSFARRHEQGAPDASKRRVVPPASDRLPLTNAVTYFLDGLAGGDRSRFGTALALEVTRVLAACEAALRVRKETAGT